MTKPFWETQSLAEMSHAQWESLCDGCGRCCAHKFENEDTGEIAETNIVCRLFDRKTCACSDYSHRLERVVDCLDLRVLHERHFTWLPESCAYRRLHEGRGLAAWHPLRSGRNDSVREAGIALSEPLFCEDDVPEDLWFDHLV